MYPFREDEGDDVDGSYFSRNRLISLNPGDVIAIKVPKIEGQDGWTVTGETLPTRTALECEITVKAGCELIDDGNSVVSAISGRPVIEQSGPNISITVDPVYIVKEVSQATGNINFAGDVEVQGNVGEACVVQADGNIQVAGDVSRAVIRAGASVVLHKMVIGSSVSAGGRAALYASVLPSIKQTRELLGKITSDAKVLKANSGLISPGKSFGDGTIIQFIIDSKFNNLPQTIEGLYKAINDSTIPAEEEVVDFVNFMRRNLCGLGATQIEKLEFLDNMDDALDRIIKIIENSMRRADYIKARYTQNCSLLSSGDVIIEGQGCYVSDIKAGGAVIICGKPGIARGVKIFADGDVTVADLGSEFESQTFVKVGFNGKISADFVHPDVLIQVGGEKYRVDKPSRSFTASVDTNGSGRLTVDRLTAEEK
jgi:formylmethanofuran dehydrogenase subunit C